jgi:glycerol-3-phosphate dehydrogenase (NAD(P)+)
MDNKIAVLGGGSWGIAIAVLLRTNGNKVSIWEFNRNDYSRLLEEREHKIKLPGVRIPDDIEIENRLDEAIEDARIICLAVPSHTVREVCRFLAGFDLPADTKVVNLAKGIEIDSLKRMSEVILEEIEVIPETNLATLSGPSHAEEVGQRMPTSVVIGSTGIETAENLRDIFSNAYFRAYSSPDIVGVELGGALKNIIAIAAGIVDGLAGGDNARGALFARGMAEISRLGIAMGAHPLTFAGLSGFGDLITTCISRHSRNRNFGEKIGAGKNFEEAMGEMTMVVEGVRTTRAAYRLKSGFGVEMPITEEVYQILFDHKNPRDALFDLMTRDLKSEI